MTEPTTKKRRRLTSGERQQERYDAAQARLMRAIDAKERATSAFVTAGRAKTAAENEHKAAEAALAYEANHPDLPGNKAQPELPVTS